MKVGAELGVQTGVFAETTLEKWKSCERYYAIDVWRHLPSTEVGPSTNLPIHPYIHTPHLPLLNAPTHTTTTHPSNPPTHPLELRGRREPRRPSTD